MGDTVGWTILGLIIVIDLFVIFAPKPPPDDRWWKELDGFFSNGGKD